MRKYMMIIIATLTMVACTPTYKGNTTGTKVGMVGDSITAYSQDKVEASLSTYHHSVTATPGIDLKDGRTQLVQPMVATKPKVMVVELGINSARDGWDSKDLPYLEGVLADTDPIPCVVWVIPDALDVSYYDNQGPGTLHTRILQFKASLEKRLPKNPNVHMAYWGDVERAHPEWYIKGDNLHNTDAGEKAYAEFVKDSISTYC